MLLGFVVHLMAAALGLTALLIAVPFAFDAIRLAGAAYLLWLAWQAVKPGRHRAFRGPRCCPTIRRPSSSAWAFVTNLLNPKVAMFYLSFFPQFLHPERGSVLLQSLQLGVVQIGVSGAVNALLVLGAARHHGLPVAAAKAGCARSAT